jgi:hypothetical protein
MNVKGRDGMCEIKKSEMRENKIGCTPPATGAENEERR